MPPGAPPTSDAGSEPTTIVNGRATIWTASHELAGI
jgi:hypothetical protein